MNSFSSTLSLPFTWLSRFRLNYQAMITQATSSPETQSIHLAFQRTYRGFAQRHPQWINRCFDDDLLRPVIVELWGKAPSQVNSADTNRVAIQLALRWDAQFGCLYTTETRICQIEELKTVTTEFLRLFQVELRR